jgi:hypothetical protein
MNSRFDTVHRRMTTRKYREVLFGDVGHLNAHDVAATPMAARRAVRERTERQSSHWRE